MMTSHLEGLGRLLQAGLPAMQADLEELVSLESPTLNKAAVDRAQSWLVERLQRAGASVERRAQTEAGDHVSARWPASRGYAPEMQPVLLLGHMDTVWPLGELHRRPLRVQDGYLYGPGAYDMKAGLVMLLHAMEALRELDVPWRRAIELIVNTDEEVGSLTSREMIEAEARRCSCALVLEPAMCENGLTVSRKGVGRFRLHVQGRAAHAGHMPNAGVSAVEELAHQVVRLQGMNAPAEGISVNVGVVHGGTRPNVIPAEAHAEVDLRVERMGDGERMTSALLGLTAHNPLAGVRVEGGLTRPPWERNTACEALFHRARAVGLAMGLSLERYSSGGGSDGNFAAALGLPTLDGLGPEGAGAHAEDERVYLASLPQRGVLLAGLLTDLSCNGGR